MTASAAAAPEQSQRAWWLRSLLVLQSPRPVFAALRDDSEGAAHARQEPITALVFLAGMGAVLGSPTTGRLLDDPELDGLLIAVLVFLAGGVYGFFGYWLGGGALYAGARAAGGAGSYRRARHLLAFAATPLALALALLPLRVALYGGDSFRTGGGDSGAAGNVFDGIELALAAWALVLLLVDVRAVYRLSWPRSVAVLLLGVLVLLSMVLFFALIA